MHYFFQDLEKTYNEEVPYHNAIHATDVLQGVYFSLQRGEGYVSFDVFMFKNLYYLLSILKIDKNPFHTDLKIHTGDSVKSHFGHFE